MKLAEHNEATQRFAQKKLLVLCACDLLNEGWDCPHGLRMNRKQDFL